MLATLINGLTALLQQVFKMARGASEPQSEPVFHVIPRDEHNISRQDISEPAKKVLHRLNKGGYDAYLVGGGVRDLLLGLSPKDYDIATNATPEQVHELFRNSRLIGRRFRLVHVLFGREMIEVTTFRGNPEDAKHKAGHSVNDQGRLLRDNVYGNQEEDALRRDFTVNALYYDIRDFSVHDYANGVRDLKARQLRLIGDPATRYREDPVRMLRAIRFAVKLDFEIAPDTAGPIHEQAHLLRDIPPARLFEEILKLFTAGQGQATYQMLQEYDLFAPLFPDTDSALEEGESDEVIRQALANTDRRVQENKPITPYFLFAALLWPALRVSWRKRLERGEPNYQALHQAASEVQARQSQSIAIPKRFAVPMKEVWELQVRLPKRQGNRAELLLEHPRFRAAYDFLLVRERAGEDCGGLGDWWTRYQSADEEQRRQMIKALAPATKPRKRRRRSPRTT